MNLDDLKSRSDIVEVARDLGLTVKKSGKTFFILCPSHKDAKPSNCSLIPSKGAKCFLCGWSADVIGLVEKVKGCDTGEAIRWLAARSGMADEDQPKVFFGSKKGRGLGNKKKAKAAPSYPKGQPLPPEVEADIPPPPEVDTHRLPEVDDQPVADLVAPPVVNGAPGQPTVKIIWAAAAKVAVFSDQWRRLEDGQIEAEYNRDQWQLLCSFTDKPFDAKAFDRYAKARPHRPALKPTIRSRVYAALLTHLRPPPSEGAIWLRDHKGISFDTQAAFKVGWLADWAKADRDLRAEFGADALAALGLMTLDQAGRPVELRFKSHRLIFPFLAPQGDGLACVYVQARNIHADHDGRFMRPSDPTPCPYNLHLLDRARKTGQPVFATEGESDCLTLNQSGRLAVGIIGATGFKPEWAKAFAGLEVFITRDPDEAGAKFAKMIAEAFVAAGLPAPKVVRLPAGQDVTDIFTGAKSKKVIEDEEEIQ